MLRNRSTGRDRNNYAKGKVASTHLRITYSTQDIWYLAAAFGIVATLLTTTLGWGEQKLEGVQEEVFAAAVTAGLQQTVPRKVESSLLSVNSSLASCFTKPVVGGGREKRAGRAEEQRADIEQPLLSTEDECDA